jgi:hypothetical protein
MMKHIIFTSALVFASAMTGEAMAVCSGTQLTGDNGTRETAVVTFTALTAGQSVTIAGLTYTLKSTTTSRNANQVSNAFNGLNDGDTSGPSAQAVFGNYTGTFTGWRSTPGGAANTKTFTSVTFGNVTNIATVPALAVATTDGTGAPSLGNLLRNSTVCVGTPGNWEAQEFHKPGGDLIDWKKGATDPVDPTASVGTWDIIKTNTPNPLDARINYKYGSTTYTNTVWLHPDGTYSFCNQVGNETIPAKIINGQASCQ